MCVEMAKVVEYSHVLCKKTFKLQVTFDKEFGAFNSSFFDFIPSIFLKVDKP
jgi:hypothetical protein